MSYSVYQYRKGKLVSRLGTYSTQAKANAKARELRSANRANRGGNSFKVVRN